MLERILADTRRRLARSQALRPLSLLARQAEAAPPPLDLAAALAQPGVQLIAEVKRRSPSRGELCPGLHPAALAAAYARGGAAALSVLTEPQHFGGSLADLAAARAGLDGAGRRLPILRKDFFVDPYQVVEARAHGADAILLIVAALDPARLARLLAEARRWGLAALVEVHSEEELDQALTLGPRIVGLNSRNLADMTLDPAVVERLRPRIPPETLVVAESGIRGPADVRRVRQAGVDAVLVGEALVRAADAQALARDLVEAGR